MSGTWLEAGIIAVVAGVVGFFVVVRGATFAAHAIPQGAFTGAAGAALAGIDTLVGVGTFAALGALTIARWGRRARHDVVTALTLVGALGLGALFLGLSSQYGEQTFALLFGEPLAISRAEVVPSALIAAACLLVMAGIFRPLLLSSVAPELAAVQGAKPERVETLFLLAVGAATTLALPVVGALLVFSLMIGPPSAARFLARRPTAAVGLSVALGVVTVFASVVAAYFSNLPLGFFVGCSGVAWYALGRLAGARAERRRGAVAVGPADAAGVPSSSAGLPSSPAGAQRRPVNRHSSLQGQASE
jgi:zinc/manganese transport system permease protein